MGRESFGSSASRLGATSFECPSLTLRRVHGADILVGVFSIQGESAILYGLQEGVYTASYECNRSKWCSSGENHVTVRVGAQNLLTLPLSRYLGRQ
jgi:hypothetical protein